MFIICKERTLTASYYFGIFDLSVKRCFINSWSTQNIQSTLTSQSCDSEFNMCGKANHKIQSLSQPQQAYKVTYKDRTQADTNASPLAGRCPPSRQTLPLAGNPPGRPPGQTLPPPATSRRLLQRTVRILLEYLLVCVFCLAFVFHDGMFKLFGPHKQANDVLISTFRILFYTSITFPTLF